VMDLSAGYKHGSAGLPLGASSKQNLLLQKRQGRTLLLFKPAPIRAMTTGDHCVSTVPVDD